MTKLTLVALSLFAFAGCKSKCAKAGESLAKMEHFWKLMCDCQDKTCANKVDEEMTKWSAEMAKTAEPTDDKPDPEIVKKTADITTKYTECMTKLTTGKPS